MMPSAVQILLIGGLGWAAGMAVNFCVDLFHFESLSSPRCRQCRQPQPAWVYFIWPRICPNCASRRGMRTWIVEGTFLLLALWTWSNRPSLLEFAVGLGLLVYLGIVWVIDQERRLIPNLLSAIGLVIGVIFGGFRNGLIMTLIGGMAGFSLMLCLFWFGYVFIRVANRWRNITIDDVALGFGDVLLGGVIGLLVGWPLIVSSLLVTVFVSGLISLLYLGFRLATRSYAFGLAIPYAPFMILGAFYSLYLNPIF